VLLRCWRDEEHRGCGRGDVGDPDGGGAEVGEAEDAVAGELGDQRRLGRAGDSLRRGGSREVDAHDARVGGVGDGDPLAVELAVGSWSGVGVEDAERISVRVFALASATTRLSEVPAKLRPPGAPTVRSGCAPLELRRVTLALLPLSLPDWRMATALPASLTARSSRGEETESWRICGPLTRLVRMVAVCEPGA
jgi:hypothetical protein